MARVKTKRAAVAEQPDLLAERPVERVAPALPIMPVQSGLAAYIEPVSFPETLLADRGAFGAWLVQQRSHRREWVAGLARAAKADHRFPTRGSVDDVRKYLTDQGADGDAFEALDDAEVDWLAL